MKKHILLSCLLSGFMTTLQAQYTNPVIPGFYPDPSICRVDSDFYLVNSSFEFFPGVPLFHSRDLVNWNQIGHCLTRPSQLNLNNCYSSGGIYAPTIRFHDGTFFMITTNVTDKGNFIVHTKDPKGEWSEPVWLKQGGIDPSLFFEDNKCYLTSNPGDCIWLSEINPFTGEQLTEMRPIWSGTGGRYPEGPHLYKKDGWYYLLISEGGTEYGHKVTVARSKNIYGPYESNPSNPILTHINKNAQTSPIQGTGHADLVQAPDGSWWMVFLAFRPQSGLHHVLGRETFLAPVRWDKDAWPVVNGDGTVALEMNIPTIAPAESRPKIIKAQFTETELAPEWTYLRNPDMKNYKVDTKKSCLRLRPSTIDLDHSASPTFIGRRQQHIDFKATTNLQLFNAQPGDQAGITIYRKNGAHYDLYIEQDKNDKLNLILKYKIGPLDHIAFKQEISEAPVTLQISGDKDNYSFAYSQNDKPLIPIGNMEVKYLSTETNGGFTGAFIGLYTVSLKDSTKGYADFNDFIYESGK